MKKLFHHGRHLQALCLRAKTTKGASADAPDVIPAFIGDTGLELTDLMTDLGNRLQTEWVQPPEYDNEEDTPQYFTDYRPEDLVVRIDVLKAGTPRWPLLPEVDVRKLSNVEWASETRQQMNAAYCAKYDITPTIFPALNFDVNLNVRFGDMYWHSAFFGNYLQPSEVQTAPEIHISADPTDDIPEGSLFTLVMFTPDYPFRTSPEDGHLLHWMVCNVPLGSNASFDTVVDYMPPLPTEYAGHFRYLFALFKQDGRLTLPEQSPADHYPLNQRRNFFLHATRPYNTPQDMNIMHVQQSLPAHPTALTFFHCSYDWEVSEYYQTHQLEEPIYTPEDLLQKALMYEKYSEDQRFDAFQRTPDWQKIWPETYRRYEPSEPEKAPDMWERHKGRRKAGLKSRGRKPKRYR